jgi:HlyD family secretion protein
MEGRKRLPIIIAILVIAVIAGGIFWYWDSTRVRPLVLYGNVDLREAQLAFNASERIQELRVEEGARVKKGDVLARLNTRTLELAISKCKADIRAQQALLDKAVTGSRPEEIAETQAAVREAQAQADNASKTYRRMESLFASGAVSQQTRDDAAAAYKAAAAALKNAEATRDKAVNGSRVEDIEAQRATLDSLKEQLKTYEYELSQATLIAPQDGVIRSRLLEVGDMASPSKPVYLLSIDTKKWIRCYVQETRLGELHEGKKAQVKIDSVDKTLPGTVGFISGTAEFTPKNVQTEELRTALLYEVRVMVEDPDNVLRLGMPATVSF